MLQAGDVVQVEFPGSQGIKRRPAVVLSSEIYHKTRPDVLLTVVTSNVAIATTPTDYVLHDWEDAGLSAPSAVRIYISARLQYQVTRIGRLSEEDWREVQTRLEIALDLSKE